MGLITTLGPLLIAQTDESGTANVRKRDLNLKYRINHM